MKHLFIFYLFIIDRWLTYAHTQKLFFKNIILLNTFFNCKARNISLLMLHAPPLISIKDMPTKLIKNKVNPMMMGNKLSTKALLVESPLSHLLKFI